MLNQYQFEPPEGYYRQAPANKRRPADAEDLSTHLARLGEALNGRATMVSPASGSHMISVQHHGDGTSYMIWQNKQGESYARPGEIDMIRSKQPGAASVIHDTARAIAKDHPATIAFPKHSSLRSLKGAQWVHNEQTRHGEQLWGIPISGHPAFEAYLQQHEHGPSETLNGPAILSDGTIAGQPRPEPTGGPRGPSFTP